MRHARLLIVLLLLLAGWVAVHALGLREHFNLPAMQQGLAMHPVAGLLLFVLLFSVGNLLHVPGWLFLAAAVLTLGPLWGGLTTYLAASVACVVTFASIRLLGGQALRGFDGRLARRIFAQLDRHPVRTVALLRLLFQTAPVLNCALALSGVGLRGYVLGTLLGLPLPIAVYSVFLRTLAAWLHWPLP